MATKTYYLVKGNTISSKGMPGGSISAKTANVALTAAQVAKIQKSLEYLIAQGKITTVETTAAVKSTTAAKKTESTETTSETTSETK